jgi:hypothetical protein
MGWRNVLFVCLAVTLGWSERATAQSLSLSWDPSPDPSVAGYIVYAGMQPGAYTAEFNVGGATSFVYAVVPGQQYFFAVAAYAENMLVGPRSPEVAGSAPGSILLSNPGDQFGSEGSATELQLVGMDSFGGTATITAAGLPPGLDVDSTTGLVSGTPTTAGVYAVTVIASTSVSSASQTFIWTIVTGDDTTPPVVTVTLPAISDRGLKAASPLTIGGMATDDDAIVEVSWVNSRGGSGVATGTDVWLAGVLLSGGRNDITITAVDRAGNRGSTTISIYRQL